MQDVGEEVTKLPVTPLGSAALIRNATLHGPPDFLLLDVDAVRSKKTKMKLMNTTLSYSFKVERQPFYSRLSQCNNNNNNNM